jgi:hypothetical protein
MENEVKVLKLITGEDIVTMITEGKGESVILENPLKIGYNSDEPLSISLGLWTVTAKTDHIIMESKHILAILEPVAQTIENYLGAVADIEGHNNSRPYSGSGEIQQKSSQGISSGFGSGAPNRGFGIGS